MRVTFKPRNWSEVKVGDVVTFDKTGGGSKPLLRYMRVYEIFVHTDSHGVAYTSASLGGIFETKTGKRHGVLNPPTYAGKQAYADYVRLAWVVSVTGNRDWIEDPAEAYDAAKAERDAALRAEAAERLHTNDVYRVLGYGRDLPGDPTSHPGVGEMPLPSGRLITFADLREHASDLVADWHGEARKEDAERDAAEAERLADRDGDGDGWGQPVKDVHTEHCCAVHGCKYGYGDPEREAHCTVASGRAPQSYPCEQCPDEGWGQPDGLLGPTETERADGKICGMCGGYGCTLCTPKANTPAEARTGISDRAHAALEDVDSLRHMIGKFIDPEGVRTDMLYALGRIDAALRGAR